MLRIMTASAFFDDTLKIGDVFTPVEWGQFAIDEHKLFSPWLAGKTIFDPTMGEGKLLEAFVIEGLERGYRVEDLPLHNLFGCEKCREYHDNAITLFKSKYNIDLSENFALADFIQFEARQFDIILGNPPWRNFVDLPDPYKEELKAYFHQYDLVNNAQLLLLGGSRIDISSLIIKKALSENLVDNGLAVFFCPLSLLLNDGANHGFRNYAVHDCDFRLLRVHDFSRSSIFDKVTTKFGLIALRKNEKNQFPVRYSALEDGLWKDYLAQPLLGAESPLSIMAEYSSFQKVIKPIRVSEENVPRQGVNTGGANNILFFDSYRDIDESTCLVNESVELPSDYVFPLITKTNFENPAGAPRKWVLLPYQQNGKPLTEEFLKKEKLLYQYLLSIRNKLSGRKGKILKSRIDKGIWWILLGVGAYNFARYKVVWQAYGKREFKPVIFEGRWQVNQSLQAYIPCRSLSQARRIQKELSASWVEEYLLSFRMGGTMNWAQPGGGLESSSRPPLPRGSGWV